MLVDALNVVDVAAAVGNLFEDFPPAFAFGGESPFPFSSAEPVVLG